MELNFWQIPQTQITLEKVTRFDRQLQESNIILGQDRFKTPESRLQESGSRVQSRFDRQELRSRGLSKFGRSRFEPPKTSSRGQSEFEPSKSSSRGQSRFESPESSSRGQSKFKPPKSSFRDRSEFEPSKSSSRGRSEFEPSMSSSRGRSRFRSCHLNYRDRSRLEPPDNPATERISGPNGSKVPVENNQTRPDSVLLSQPVPENSSIRRRPLDEDSSDSSDIEWIAK